MDTPCDLANRRLTTYALRALKEGGYDAERIRVVEKVGVVLAIGNTACAELEGVLYVIQDGGRKTDVYVLDDDAYYMSYSVSH